MKAYLLLLAAVLGWAMHANGNDQQIAVFAHRVTQTVSYDYAVLSNMTLADVIKWRP